MQTKEGLRTERKREEDSGERKGQASATGFGRRLEGKQWYIICRYQDGATSTVISNH